MSLPVGQRPQRPGAYDSATSDTELIIQDDGNLVAYNGSNPAQRGSWWESGTSGTTHEPRLVGGPNLTAGMELRPNEYIRNVETSTPHALILQDDGNLVIYEPGKVGGWDSNTDGFDVSRLVVEETGNVVLESRDGETILHTATGGHPGAYLRLGNDGNLVVYERVPGADDRPIWSMFRDNLVQSD